MTNIAKKHPFGHFRHFRSCQRSLLDPEKTLGDIGLQAGDAFLDGGCGEGRFSIAASEIVGSGGRVYAVDISKEAINNLREEAEKKNIRNIEAFTGDITQNMPVEEKR